MEEKEGSTWFWRIFGGAILGMVTFLSVTLINVINATNQQNKSDLAISIQEMRMDIKDLSSDLSAQKEKLSAIESAKIGEEIKFTKQKLDEVSKVVSDRNEKIAAIESSLEALKQKANTDSYKELYEKIVSLEHELKALKEKSQDVSKETEIKKTSLRE